MTALFAIEAPRFWERGYSVVPIEPDTKRPAKELKGWQGFCSSPPNVEKQRLWCDRYADHGIGLLLHTLVAPKLRIVAVDVDDDGFVAVARTVLGDCASGKRGMKGATFFAVAPDDQSVKSTTLTDPGKAGKIDILANGRMTVIPPSTHPDAGEQYAWDGRPLLDCEPGELPILDRRKLELLKLIVGSEHAGTLMGGEGTHNAGVALTAALVAFGCDDGEIEGIVTSLLPSTYEGDSLRELPGWIRSARDKGFDIRGILPVDDDIARGIEAELKPLAFIPGEGFRRYQDGSWPLLSDRDIDRRAKSLLVPRLKPTQQVRSYLSGVRQCLELNLERSEFGRSAARIGLQNGVFNVETGMFEEHAPEHELRFRLDFAYDPEAKCPVYLEQLVRTFTGNAKAMHLFDEFAGLTLVPDMRFQKALYLVGAGGSGKSTLLRVLESMHDPEAVTVTPLDRIDNERYLTNLATKLVCISYDVQTRRSVFGEAFVRITGGDPVAIRKLYQEVEGRVVPTVRFVGSMNFDTPPSHAASDALRRRLIFLPCGARVESPDPDRFEKLKKERPGILIHWIKALQRLRGRGGFEIPEESLNEVSDYTTMQDPVELFAQEKLETDPNVATTISEITREFNWWADEHEEKHLQGNTLGRRLKALGFESGFSNVNKESGRRSCRVVRARIVAPRRDF